MRATASAIATALVLALGAGVHSAQAAGLTSQVEAMFESDQSDAANALLREQAERGDAQAQYRLGRIAEQGKGLPAPQPRQAIEWYRKAADQMYGPAEFALGDMYLDGKGVPQDYRAAEYWLERGAHDGDDRAQLELGKMFEDGLGQTADPVMAYVWYDLAAEQGNGVARANRDRLAKSMSPDDLNEAQRIVPSISRYVSGAEVPPD